MRRWACCGAMSGSCGILWMWCGGVVCVSRRARAGFVAAHYLPALDRLRGCPEGSCRIAPALRRRPVELSRCLTRRRARRWRVAQPSFCTLRTQPVKRASGFRARRTRVRPDTDLSTARRGPVGAPVFLLACGPGRLAALQFGPLALRRTPHRARNRVDAASNNSIYHRAKPRAERQRGRRSPLLPGAGQHRFSHLAAPRDAARLAWVPQR